MAQAARTSLPPTPTATAPSPAPPSPTCTTNFSPLRARPPPVLHLTLPAVSGISGVDGLSSLWTVFSKCKESIQDGERLENISWRLWAQACANAEAGPSHHRDRDPVAVVKGDGEVVLERRGSEVETEEEEVVDDEEEGSSGWEDEGSEEESVGESSSMARSDRSRSASASGSRKPRLSRDEIEEEEEEEGDGDHSSEFETTSEEDTEDDDEPPVKRPVAPVSGHLNPKAPTTANGSRPTVGRKHTSDRTVVGAGKDLAAVEGGKGKEKERKASFASTASSRSNAKARLEAASQRKLSAGSSTGSTSSRGRKHDASASGRKDSLSPSSERRSGVSPKPFRIPTTTSSSTATPGLSTSTPKASSYPTPSQSMRPSYTFTRSQSHLPHNPDSPAANQPGPPPSTALAAAAAAAAAHRSAQAFALAKARRANRPFGEVLKDVFRVPSVTEVVEAASHEGLRRKASEGGLSLGGGAVGSGFSMVERKPSTSESPFGKLPLVGTPGEYGTPRDLGGDAPELRLVEPTPVPSRVGSLGGESPQSTKAASPIARHDHIQSPTVQRVVSGSGGFGSGLMPMTRMRSSTPVYSPQEEKADPIANLPGLSSRPGSREPSPARQTSLSSEKGLTSPQRKKGKKSIFYIQSPGDKNRYGSVSGSDTSASSLASAISPQAPTVAKLGGSPLASTEAASDQALSASAIKLETPSSAVMERTETSETAKSPELSRIRSRRLSTTSSHGGRHPHSHHAAPSTSRKVSGESATHGGQPKSHANRQMTASGAAAPKRTASAAQMAGKFQGEKARAAAAIAARLQAQQEAEREKQAEKRREYLTLAKRQQSAPNLLAQNLEDEMEVIEGTAEDDEDWSSETDEAPVQDVLMFGKGKGKGKGKNSPMDLARAADEAQRQRELFAKRAIFGTSTPAVSGLSGAGAPAPATSVAKPGLLSNLFETQRDVIRRGESMVNLQKAMSSTDHLPGKHTHGAPHNFPLNRSKSVVAMPQTSGVSVGRSGFVEPPQGMNELPKVASPAPQPAPRGKLRLPPRPGPAAEDMSPSSSPDNESSILATSEAVRRLEAFSARRQPNRSATQPNAAVAPKEEISPKSLMSVANHAMLGQDGPTSQPLQRVQSNPIPAQYNSALAQQLMEPSMPQTPTTRRRQMLATELPEDLRLNLLWERRSRAPMYPNKGRGSYTNLKASASAHDLPATQSIDRQLSNDSAPDMARQSSDPPERVAATSRGPLPPSNLTPKGSLDAQQAAVLRRKPGPNLLSGGNLLRPLTQTKARSDSHPERPATAQGGDLVTPSHGLAAQRSQSVVNLGEYQQQQMAPSVRQAASSQQVDGNLRRRMTDGDAQADEAAKRMRSLREREEELSSSFRSHGW